MRARKRDANEKDIVDSLRRIGCLVFINFEGNGYPDLTVSLGRRLALIEVKESEGRLLRVFVWLRGDDTGKGGDLWTSAPAMELVVRDA